MREEERETEVVRRSEREGVREKGKELVGRERERKKREGERE